MRMVNLIVGGFLCLAAGVGEAAAQATVLPGGPVGGGGASASAGYHVRGSVGGGPWGVATSAAYVATGGIIASLPYGPVFTVQPTSVNPPAGAPLTVSASVVSGAGVTMAAFYRQGGQSAYESVALSSGDGVTFTGAIPATAIGIRGLEYYVAATHAGGTSTEPPYGAAAPYVVQVALAGEAAPRLPDASYRLFGFPFVVAPATVADVFQDDLGAPDTTLWRLGRWDQTLAGGAGGYRQFADVGAIERGNGYWVIARGGKVVDASGLSAIPDLTVGETRYGTLTLQPGWNQIATPFAFRIDWAARLEDVPADIEDALWDYTGAGYQGTTLLEPFRGYWVRNAGTASRTLRLPYREYAPPLRPVGPRVARSPAGWRLELALASGDLADRAQTIGVDAAARDGHDPLDYSRPPAPDGPFLSIVSLLDDGSGAPLALAGDIRAPGARGQRFALLVRGSTAGPGTLAALGAAGLPDGYAIALVDVASGRAYALPAHRPLTLPRTVTADGARYDLLVGESDWLLEQGGRPEAMPERVAMLQNYPNPFNPRTTISFDLPGPGRARLTIFDTAGRSLGVLLDREMSAGRHTLVWTGRDARGRAAASGPYFYRLEAGGATETRRMMLVR